MVIAAIAVGNLATNCYIVSCDDTKEAVVIDPGGDADRIIDYIDKEELKVKYIINTHGHHDHILANREIKDHTNAELLIHEDDAPMLVSPEKNFSEFLGDKNQSPKEDKALRDGELIKFGKACKFKVIHTPGHTQGGICLYAEEENILFAGDTLFYGSIGRTDLPGSNYQKMIKSLTRLMKLPDKTMVLPGHGPKTSIANEKHINPYIK